MKFLNKKTILLSLGLAALALTGCDNSPNKYVGRYVNGENFVRVFTLKNDKNAFAIEATLPELKQYESAGMGLEKIIKDVVIKDQKVYGVRDNTYYGEFKSKNDFYFENTRLDYKRQ